MRTAFTLTQLADPAIAEADRILRACVHCGFCTATCPTYVLLGDELDSPRGRIYLIKDMLEDGRPATAEVVKHLDRCLSCLSCMTTCPSGVHYMHLIDHARSHVEKTYRRPLAERAWRALLAQVLPRRGLLRLALLMGVLGKPLAPLLRRLRFDRLAALLRLASPPAATSAGGRRVVPAQGSRRGRVALLSGCVNAVMAPQINEAAIGVLTRHGIEVVLAGEGCCGALVHHMGRDEDAAANARANVEVWNRELEAEGLDAILITASGCGTMVKDYGYLLRSDPGYADRAARISALTMDVCAYLSRLDLVPRRRTGLTVAYHAACSLQHGQRVIREPKALLAAAGFIVKDVPEGHLCCGSAGVYNILQPALADRLLDRKIANIQTLGCDLVAAGNIGCIAQIGSVHDKPVVHTVALIDWATGGPPPPGLDGRA